jgi:DNA-binding PadR family transcriptional regulator
MSSTARDEKAIDDFVDLTAFQRDVLWTLAREDGLSGATVKATLEAYYDKEVNPGSVYPGLNHLADLGLIEKAKRDERTNEYTLTDEGRRALSIRRVWEGESP